MSCCTHIRRFKDPVSRQIVLAKTGTSFRAGSPQPSGWMLTRDGRWAVKAAIVAGECVLTRRPVTCQPETVDTGGVDNDQEASMVVTSGEDLVGAYHSRPYWLKESQVLVRATYTNPSGGVSAKGVWVVDVEAFRTHPIPEDLVDVIISNTQRFSVSGLGTFAGNNGALYSFERWAHLKSVPVNVGIDVNSGGKYPITSYDATSNARLNWSPIDESKLLNDLTNPEDQPPGQEPLRVTYLFMSHYRDRIYGLAWSYHRISFGGGYFEDRVSKVATIQAKPDGDHTVSELASFTYTDRQLLERASGHARWGWIGLVHPITGVRTSLSFTWDGAITESPLPVVPPPAGGSPANAFARLGLGEFDPEVWRVPTCLGWFYSWGSGMRTAPGSGFVDINGNVTNYPPLSNIIGDYLYGSEVKEADGIKYVETYRFRKMTTAKEVLGTTLTGAMLDVVPWEEGFNPSGFVTSQYATAGTGTYAAKRSSEPSPSGFVVGEFVLTADGEIVEA